MTRPLPASVVVAGASRLGAGPACSIASAACPEKALSQGNGGNGGNARAHLGRGVVGHRGAAPFPPLAGVARNTAELLWGGSVSEHTGSSPGISRGAP